VIALCRRLSWKAPERLSGPVACFGGGFGVIHFRRSAGSTPQSALRPPEGRLRQRAGGLTGDEGLRCRAATGPLWRRKWIRSTPPPRSRLGRHLGRVARGAGRALLRPLHRRCARGARARRALRLELAEARPPKLTRCRNHCEGAACCAPAAPGGPTIPSCSSDLQIPSRLQPAS
jgi:hypothetical protein